MKYFLFIFCSSLFTAQFIKNDCDKKILTEKEYQKCLKDSIYKSDFEPRINYITTLTTKVLPKYRAIRKKIEFDHNITQKVDSLREIYNNQTEKKLYTYQKDVYKNGMFVSPKSYISTNLAFQNFMLYPDVFALLVNRNNLIVTPRNTENELECYQKLMNDLYTKLSEKQKIEIAKIVLELRRDKLEIQTEGPTEILQGIGILNEQERNKYDIIDFLIWNE